MTRRRDLRRFGPGPYVTALRRDEQSRGSGLPFDVPAVAAAGDLALDAPVTLLGGKSTLIEAIAEAVGFAPEGGEPTRLGELPAVPRPVPDGGRSSSSRPTRRSCSPVPARRSSSSTPRASRRPPTTTSTRVRLTRGFPEAPERYLRAALDADDAAV